MTINEVIGFIGAGNMAKAIVEGILKKGLVPSSQIIVSAPSEATLENWKALSVQTTHLNGEVIKKADIIILAVKPHQLNCALESVHIEKPLSKKIFVSILAGVSSDVIYKKLFSCIQFNGSLFRVMPNILTLVGEGCSAIAAHCTAMPEDAQLVKSIFSTLGKCEVVPEYLIPAITGLSGSGPAYIFIIIEALADGAVKQGLPRSLANSFAAQTVLGAAKMVLETGKHPAQLKDEVCSAGGTTIHAVHALEKGGLRATLMNAIEAAVKRAGEISDSNS